MLHWRAGLRSRLVLLVVIALMPICALVTYTAVSNERAAIELAHADLQSEALLAAAHQQRMIQRIFQLLSDMASGPSIKDTRIRLCVPYLKNLKQQDERFANLGVIGLDGVASCHALEAEASGRLFLGDRTFFKQVLATKKLAVGDFGLGPATGLPSMVLGLPVHGNDGEINGVAFVALNLAAVSDTLSRTRPLAGAQTRVLDRRHVILGTNPAIASGPGAVGSVEPDAIGRVAASAQQPGFHDALDAQGVRQVYAYAPVGGTDGALFVLVSMPRSLITSGPRESLLAGFLGLLLVTTFGLALAWWSAGRLIVRPAKAILKGAEEITRGNLTARVNLGPTHQGEFAVIGQAFNRMAESLQARVREVDDGIARVNEERAIRDLILNSMSEGVLAIDTQGRMLMFNNAVGESFSLPHLGVALDDWRSNYEFLNLEGTRVYPFDERPLTLALRGVIIDKWEVLLRKPGSEDKILCVAARPITDAAGQLLGAVTVFSDITIPKAAEKFEQSQKEVLTLIARGAPLNESCEAIVRLVCSTSPDGICSILLARDQRLYNAASTGLPQQMLDLIDGLPIANGAGACGTAASLKQLVVVENTATDPLMAEFSEALQAHNLQACWSMPVLCGAGKVLATFAIYHHRPRRPQAKDLELLDTAARLARIAIERSIVEVALTSSEARFREMAENIHDIFYNRDAHTGRVLYVSPGYEKQWGQSRESLYADPHTFLTPVLPLDRAILKQRQQPRDGSVSDIEFRIAAPDGQTRWMRDMAYPVSHDGDEVKRVVGIVRDITDRKLSEMALANVNRAMQMLSRSSVAINALDSEAGLLAEVCRVAVEVGGYRMAWVGFAQHDELSSILPVAHAGHEAGYLSEIVLSWRDDLPQGQGPGGRTIRLGCPQHISEIGNRSSHFFWQDQALARGYRSALFLPLRNGQGCFGLLALYSAEVQNFAADEINLLQELADNVAFGLGSLRARELAEQAAVKISEQASLLDRAQDAIMVRNLDRTIRYWNKGAERLYGWAADEVVGKSMDALMYRDPQIPATAMAQTLANNGDWNGELEQRAKDGSAVFVEARWNVVRDANGVVNGVLGINTDIRERKQAREQVLALNASLEERVLQRTAQLEFANQQLEAFSYSVSHDLRTPLSSVNGFSHLLEKALGKLLQGPEAQRSNHYLSRIRSGVAKMGDLIDAMLSLAQVSRTDLRWEPMDLSAMAASLLAGYQERDPDRAVLLNVEPGLMANGDPRLLNQVLDNLIGNAWKFSAGQARTEISFGCNIGDKQKAEFFVRDNGAGFDMQYYEKLFGPFERLHSPAEFAGSGIGLTTVQRIILRHGGNVWAEAAPGKGATFYFTLGLAKL